MHTIIICNHIRIKLIYFNKINAFIGKIKLNKYKYLQIHQFNAIFYAQLVPL